MGIFNPLETINNFIEDPIETVIDEVTQPIRDGIEVFHGLTEGEIRMKATARLGADVVAGMAVGEIIDYLGDEI